MTPEARAARERKQKIFVVVGGLFLVALLAFQLPKILGGSSSPEATPASTDSSQLQTEPTSTGAQAVALASALPVARTGKITSFSAFVAKDPFVQQVVTSAPVGAAEGGSGGGSDGGEAAAKGADDGSVTKEFATGKTSSAAATIVTVNGMRQVLEAGMKFPATDPLFVLVAEKPGSKAIVVGIAGGAYSGGAKTTTLRVGKPLTLVNTATGAKYKVSLVSVGSGDVGEPATPKP